MTSLVRCVHERELTKAGEGRVPAVVLSAVKTIKNGKSCLVPADVSLA